MRIVFWLLTLAAVAVAVASAMTYPYAQVTLFLPPQRIDISLNLFVLIIFFLVFVAHGFLLALRSLLKLPERARKWQILRTERLSYGALLKSSVYLMTGRFVKARKVSQDALQRLTKFRAESAETSFTSNMHTTHALLVLIHSESCHALKDYASRDHHFQMGLQFTHQLTPQFSNDMKDAFYLSALRWCIQLHEQSQAQDLLRKFSSSATQRVVLLRLRFKTELLRHQYLAALETVRLLVKLGAYSVETGPVVLRSVLVNALHQCQEASQVQSIWSQLSHTERSWIEVAQVAAEKACAFSNASIRATDYFLSVWAQFDLAPERWNSSEAASFSHALARSILYSQADTTWLANIEKSMLAYPRSAELKFLAGVVFFRHALWGKSQQALSNAVTQLVSKDNLRLAYRLLAHLDAQKGHQTEVIRWLRLASDMDELKLPQP